MLDRAPSWQAEMPLNQGDLVASDPAGPVAIPEPDIAASRQRKRRTIDLPMKRTLVVSGPRNFRKESKPYQQLWQGQHSFEHINFAHN
jgi:hypothetical protein